MLHRKKSFSQPERDMDLKFFVSKLRLIAYLSLVLSFLIRGPELSRIIQSLLAVQIRQILPIFCVAYFTSVKWCSFEREDMQLVLVIVANVKNKLLGFAK